MQKDLRYIYEQQIIDCISHQCRNTKVHIDKYRNYFANHRQTCGYTESLRQIIFALNFERSEGAYIYDADGNEYLDISMGFGVHLFGNSPSFINERLKMQIDQGISLGPVHSLAGEVAGMICEMTGSQRCAFYNSGTEAVMVALRLAKAATGKTATVIFEGSYHGTYDPLLAMKKKPHTNQAAASVPGVPDSIVQDTVILEFNTPEAIDFIMQNANRIAAVLTEPVRSRHPEIIAPEFLHSLQTVCKENNIAFILDEVITGFRVSNGGVKAKFNLDPDIVVYGKVIGGGLPIGIVAGGSKYLDYIDGGNWSFQGNSHPENPLTFVAGTFCHHPLAMAASKATLELLQDKNGTIQQELEKKTKDLAERLNGFFKSFAIPVKIHSYSSLFRFHLKGRHKIFYHALLKEKIYLWEGRNCFLSTAHTEQDIARLERAVKKITLEMMAAGYFNGISLPGPSVKHYTGAGIEIRETPAPAMVEFAFACCITQLNSTNKSDYTYEFLFENHLVKNDSAPSLQGATFILTLSHHPSSSILNLQVDSALFDGWSMILLLENLGKCIMAIQKKNPLPDNLFTPFSMFSEWCGERNGNQIVAKKYYPAETELWILSDRSDRGNTTLFNHLLACFAISLGIGRHKIGIPVSGQLVSRLIFTAGQCTCQLPMEIEVTENATPADLAEQVGEKLFLLKKEFKTWYREKNETYCEVVFNLDNAKTPGFGNTAFEFIPVTEKDTAHDIVLNVTKVGHVLYFSMKYKQGQNSYPVNKIKEKFTGLFQNETFPAYS